MGVYGPSSAPSPTTAWQLPTPTSPICCLPHPRPLSPPPSGPVQHSLGLSHEVASQLTHYPFPICCLPPLRLPPPPPQGLSNTAWAFAKLGYPQPQLFEDLALAAVSCLERFTAQGLSNTAWAYAAAGHYQPQLMKRIAQQVGAVVLGGNWRKGGGGGTVCEMSGSSTVFAVCWGGGRRVSSAVPSNDAAITATITVHMHMQGRRHVFIGNACMLPPLSPTHPLPPINQPLLKPAPPTNHSLLCSSPGGRHHRHPERPELLRHRLGLRHAAPRRRRAV
jgi:hypothetical protein